MNKLYFSNYLRWINQVADIYGEDATLGASCVENMEILVDGTVIAAWNSLKSRGWIYCR